MNATIAVSLMVLGAWVVPEGDSGSLPLTEQQGPPVMQNPMVNPGEMTFTPPVEMERQRGMGTSPGSGYMGGAPSRTRRPAAAGMRGGAGQSAQGIFPTSPTDPLLGQSQFFPQAPTAGAGAAGMYRSGVLGGGAGRMGSTPYQPFAPNARATQQPMIHQPSYRPAQAGSSEKAFNNLKPPPAVSPWLNMFRPNSGGVDNYNTLVRPEFEQRATNQGFSSQIGGVQGTLNRQGSSLRQLNQETQMMQGIVNPNYFINYGSYYPGAASTAPPLGSPYGAP